MSSVKNEILSQEVTRKQFLQLVVGSSLMLFGFGNFLSFFKHHGVSPQSSQSGQHGFGSSKFGV